MEIMNVCLGISMLFIVVGLLFCLLDFILMRRNKIHLIPRGKKKIKTAILIPARNESKVISGLLDSLMRQTVKVNLKDVYVIIENKNDPTYKIVKEYGMNIFVRPTPERQRKGYALDECIQDILKKRKHYDAYVIFDADNILKEDCLEKLYESYEKGYDLVSSYRNSKNGNASTVAACSSLIFSLVNGMGNEVQQKCDGNVILCGTGLFISGDLIKEWGGFPFHELTEDFEISMYAVLHGIKTDYNKDAIVYDEQPLTLRQNIKQHTRWIKGFLNCAQKYSRKLLHKARKKPHNEGSCKFYGYHILPILYIVVGVSFLVITLLLGSIVFLCLQNVIWIKYFLWFILLLIAVYIILFLFTAYLLIIEKGKLNLTKERKLQCLFYNPIYMISFVPSFIIALVNPNVFWTPVEHFAKEIE